MSYSNNRNWEIRELSDAFWFQEGPGVRNWQFTRSGIKLLNVANISQYGTIDLDKTDRYLSEQEVNTKYKHFLVDEGDLVIASSGISFDEDGLLRTRGAFVHKEQMPLCMNTSTIRFKSKEGLSNLHFLRFWLNSFEFREQITRLVTGSAQQNFGPSHLKSIYITLPHITEQKRIVAILEKADRLRRQCHYALELSNTYLQSAFLEMFGDPMTNTKEWKTERLENRIAFMTSGSRGWAQHYADEGAMFLRIQNVGKNQLLLNDLAYVQVPDTAEGRRTQVRGGDLLISITADLGRTAVIPENFPEAYINQHLALLRLKELNPVFLAGFISTPGGKVQITQLDRGGVKSGLNFDDIRGYHIFVPPSSLQQKFAKFVQQFERLRAQQLEAERQAEHLFQTLLHQVFEGNVALESGGVQDEATEHGIQSSVVNSRLPGPYVQLQMKY